MSDEPQNKTYALGEQYQFLVHVPLGDVEQRVNDIGSHRGGVLMTTLMNQDRQGTFEGEGGLLLKSPLQESIQGMSRVDSGGEIADGRMDDIEDLQKAAPNSEYNQIDLKFDGTEVVGVMIKVTPDGRELGDHGRNQRLRETAERHNLPVAVIEVAPAVMPTEVATTRQDFSDGNTLTTYNIPDDDEHFLRVDIAHGNFYHSPGVTTISRSMVIDQYGQVSQQLSVGQEQRIRQNVAELQAKGVVTDDEVAAVLAGFQPRMS